MSQAWQQARYTWIRLMINWRLMAIIQWPCLFIFNALALFCETKSWRNCSTGDWHVRYGSRYFASRWKVQGKLRRNSFSHGCGVKFLSEISPQLFVLFLMKHKPHSLVNVTSEGCCCWTWLLKEQWPVWEPSARAHIKSPLCFGLLWFWVDVSDNPAGSSVSPS